MQASSVVRFSERTVEAMAASGFYDVLLGGETGDAETMAAIKKTTRPEENLIAARRLTEAGIGTQLTYIIGFPGESEASMYATLEEARRVQVECPSAYQAVWPFRPIPGTPLYREALAQGYEPPKSLIEWGSFGDYRRHETWTGHVPEHVLERRKLLIHYAALAKGVPRARDGWWEARARRRLARDDWRFGRLEARAFEVSRRVGRALGRGPRRQMVPS
jgi:radical SAM superfamily enzyme YgiQ (UPF0313 family)